MKILALETSCEIASVALLCDGELHSQTLVSPPAHSAGLLPLVRELLARHKVRLAELDVIAFGRGPGAFTGVRLACSVAQGLAVGLGLPVAPVDSLLALAEGCDASQVYCAMDARMSEVYVARYVRGEQGWQTDLAPVCVVPSAMPVPAQAGWVGVGTAFRVYPECVAALADKIVVQDANAVPGAAAVARLAGSTNWVDAAEAAPLYVRDRVALTVAERLAAGGKA
ncbi:tRNA (adenosine(37)-N6)-threonylcarbamoyltransferase complex dimerization subunit type 1 TsaB [Uliginosibacterium gangwonense]|uniref:tRNA (adenosine(37)-N6)-threonylcarbamoyltransferase complex dimerization subunit type 1 TsaB n=1 Tax=Uliginosibacterium gangwonense TaxID=392736 RepID=UPI0003665683|nr:tRNA (adenosine(37)-N6)-threonylcarbamoyltransferase complex dimerization subunit type 1 TsaB [Uliginosibacterium gangwonense]